jgi:hypothetical protein
LKENAKMILELCQGSIQTGNPATIPCKILSSL